MDSDQDSNDAGHLVAMGYDLCFGETNKDALQVGRQYLLNAAQLGRDDANYYLGRSFEREGKFSEAATIYEKGFEVGFRQSVFRLALLHNGKKLKDFDRKFYLTTIDRLADEGHAPSLAKRAKERLRGSYGVFHFFVGLLRFVPDFFLIARIAHRDPNDPMLKD